MILFIILLLAIVFVISNYATYNIGKKHMKEMLTEQFYRDIYDEQTQEELTKMKARIKELEAELHAKQGNQNQKA